MKLVERVARELFSFKHPEKPWLKHPNETQARIQGDTRHHARVLLLSISTWTGTKLDPEGETPIAT